MRRSDRKARRGFTLIEIMIVLAIIALLVGLFVVNVIGTQGRAEERSAKIKLDEMARVLDMFKVEFQRYPLEEETLAVLWDKTLLDPEADQEAWYKFTTETDPKDPWGNDWGYEAGPNAQTYRLWSVGKDGEEGTEDDIVRGGDEGEDGGSFDGGLPPSMPGE